jgi:plasmid stabilization system protein ParE
MRVYWSHEAARRLREITAYIAQDSPIASRQVAALLLRRSRTLAQPPLIGRRLPEYPDLDLRELLERPYRIIYAVTSSGIEIVTVMHYRQLLPPDPGALRGG